MPAPREHPVDAEVFRIVDRDIPDLGVRGLQVVHDVGMTMLACFDGCTECGSCADTCPENAITLSRDQQGRPQGEVRSARCLGLSCLRCELGCTERVFHFTDFLRTR